MYVDTHCHLDFDWFSEDRDQVVERAARGDVKRIIVPAIDLQNCAAVLKLAECYAGVFAAVGVHPNSSSNWRDAWLNDLRSMAQHEKVVAIGEIGLDYYRDSSPKEMQKRALVGQLALAAELKLPVILHNRESSDDLLHILAHSPLSEQERRGVLHSFSADRDAARKALDLGYYLGFTGPLTYKKADELRQVAAMVPQDRLLLETDAPFLAPQKYRGKRNEPSYVTLIAERMAAVRGVDVAEIEWSSTENALRLFGEALR